MEVSNPKDAKSQEWLSYQFDCTSRCPLSQWPLKQHHQQITIEQSCDQCQGCSNQYDLMQLRMQQSEQRGSCLHELDLSLVVSKLLRKSSHWSSTLPSEYPPACLMLWLHHMRYQALANHLCRSLKGEWWISHLVPSSSQLLSQHQCITLHRYPEIPSCASSMEETSYQHRYFLSTQRQHQDSRQQTFHQVTTEESNSNDSWFSTNPPMSWTVRWQIPADLTPNELCDQFQGFAQKGQDKEHWLHMQQCVLRKVRHT